MVVCLEQGADLHMVQLMPLPLTVTCFSKIQIGFTFLVVAHLGSPGKRAVKRVCVCGVCVTRITVLNVAFRALTLLAGRHREHPACKIGVGVVSTDLSGARCRLFAYGPADACHCIPKPYLLLPHLNPDSFNLFGTIYPDCHGKKGCQTGL